MDKMLCPRIRVISFRDKEAFLDYSVSEQQARDENVEDKDNNESHINLYYTAYMGLRATWPFICFSGLEEQSLESGLWLWVINVHDHNVINRIRLPDPPDLEKNDDGQTPYNIVNTCISDDLELFVLTRGPTNYYLYVVSLENMEAPRTIDPKDEDKYLPRLKPITLLVKFATEMDADENDPDSSAIREIHARSQNTRKNYKGMIFARTKKNLYSWKQG